MKLVVLCLFAVCCFSLANTSTNITERKLQEVLRQLKDVRLSLQQHDQNMTLNTPPRNIEDCCCLSALQCFRANLQVKFNAADRKTNKLYRSLSNPITERGLNFCNSGNVMSTCQDCDSHPKENATEFFNRLESLIQMAITRRSMN
ncbi:interleukin-21 [Micropterus dolomieu]|uniref:interleukin-21 n=1 Tax=Micropterus dolomieu TaxID=147949 RepID=UPI001E8CFBE0|nr:interleukin-21 [Micropterus dolomieu]